MPYFAVQYQILFHDTMAYGSHHYMANFKFQNIARETLLFESKVDGKIGWDEQLKDIVMLTREAYSLNLAPVGLGERVAILLTYEEPTRPPVTATTQQKSPRTRTPWGDWSAQNRIQFHGHISHITPITTRCCGVRTITP